MSVTTWFLVAAIFFLGLSRLMKIGSRAPGLPPGPPTKPLLGNALDFPTTAIYRKFTEWAQAYGDIFSLKVASGTVVVLSGPKMVRELLDKRSISTSNRPPLHFADLVTDGNNMGFVPYDAVYKNMRRAVMTLVSKEACVRHVPVQVAEASQLMYDLLKRPEAYFTHVDRFAFSTILSLVFGVRVPRYESDIIQTFFRLEHVWEDLATPGHHPPVDLLPILRYLPERWAQWKGLCRDLKGKQDNFYYGLVDACEARIKDDAQNGSFMEAMVQDKSLGLSRGQIAYLGHAILSGGSVTTTSFLRTLVACLATYPKVQRQAHEEIDRVVGSGRTPTLEDIQHMPYIQAIIKEVTRFCPPAPFGLPHYSTAEETVGGYVIPKDSIIFINIFGVYHDEAAYDKPHVFNPDRFLDSEFGTMPGADDTDRRADLHFGAGRRICPGMILGNNAMALTAMSFIWGFDIGLAQNPKTGHQLTADPRVFTESFVISSAEIPADIRPRSEAHACLIHSQYKANRAVLKNFEHDLTQEDNVFVNSW